MKKINVNSYPIRNTMQYFYYNNEKIAKNFHITTFIEKDNLQELKIFIGSKQTSFDETLFPSYYVISDGHKFNVDNLNLLDYCALFGSVNCFNFLKLNNAPLSAATVDFAIIGGDFQIIHQLEMESQSFDYHFYTSIMSHHMEISEWLLSNYKCEFFSPVNSILFCDYRAFLFLLLNGADVSKDLYLYCSYKNPLLKIIELLIKYGANPNEGEKNPIQPLISNAEANMDIIEYLLQHGADPNYGSEKLIICYDGNISIQLLKLLLKFGFDKQRAVFDVCECNNPSLELIKHLNDLGVDFNFELETYQDNFESPLSLLCLSEVPNNDAIKYLVLEKGVQVNYEKSSPLWNSCTNNVNIEIIKLLLEHGANPNFKPAKDYSPTPLYQLCNHEDLNEEAIKLLLSYGADPDFLCESYDEVGFFYQENILCALCKKDNINFDIIKTFLHLKKDMNNGNQNPIYFIIVRRPINYDLIKLLIDNGVDINKTSDLLSFHEGGFTIKGSPLSLYCRLENDIDLEVIKFFIDNKADVNQLARIPDNYHFHEFSPLYSLSNKENVNTAAINLLISNNAKIIDQQVSYEN